VFVFIVAQSALAAAAMLLVLRLLGLLTIRTEQIAQAIIVGTIAMAVGRGVAVALFAPHAASRRFAPVDDRSAEFFSSFLVWGAVAFALTVILQSIHKAVFAPLIITVATNALFAAVVAGLLAGLAARFGQLKQHHAVNSFAAQWMHPLALIMAGCISVALVAGYASFAAFLALRVVVAAAVFGGLYLLLELIRAMFAGSDERTNRRHAFAAHIGVSEHGLGLIGALLSGVLRLLLVAMAAVVIIGPWEISTADLFDTIRNVPFGFKIADIHLSLVKIFGALTVLAVLIVLTRVAQRWLERDVLPRTRLEASLQQSIAAIFGYVGIIAAIAIALGNLGIDLQKIALVAGALSVGIGFGLQSIVSNFVSGLILLAERPIRLGDAIVVKGEEGWVRRVRVRATEIETYDRASVIIPNSELITGVVKNWTRANTLGRLVVKVGAPYGIDAERIQNLLIGIAKAHPQVVQSPAPGAFLLGFGQTALEFELRCIVTDVENALSVKSDLHFAVIKAFRAEGIEMGPDPLTLEALRRQLLGAPDAQMPVQGIRRVG
jgi:small-conductance mechanosensitive channel